MASIFTYDPDPPRVSSPWAVPNASTARALVTAETALPPPGQSPQPSFLADCGITKLAAEPQEGGTEYKLHLLLRPRRSFTSSSTGIHIVGSQHSKPLNSSFLEARSVSDSIPTSTAPSNQSRHHRLQQLTTQLLWRLQQSSPYHSYSANNVVLPTLAGSYPPTGATPRPSRLLPGIEESRGAYYEIGVSDDGTLAGLTQDEMDESLGTLKMMAASLGCCVEVLRMVMVGECEWTEELANPGDESRPNGSQGEPVKIPPASVEEQIPTATQVKRAGKLWVAEAIVKPDLKTFTQNALDLPNITPAGDRLTQLPSQLGDERDLSQEDIWCPTEQIRVSLTGATTSGKSSLLGTITTSTLDNSRGKSRLSLLKHRHELASGVTSSIAQELIGYRTAIQQNVSGESLHTPQPNIEVINYASGNVSSWTDIHASSENGRLVLLSDCAGHPRYLRTTVRGLVGWAPHWLALCVAADEGNDGTGKNGSPARDVSAIVGVGLDLMEAHLGLCLKLGLPLVVIVTKLDLASKTGLKNTLAKVLSTLKAARRKPIILPAGGPQSEGDMDTNLVPNEDASNVEKAIAEIRNDRSGVIVPIVLTSAVKGIGIGQVHALLHSLPIPKTPVQAPQGLIDKSPLAQCQPSKVFHIEEIFAFPKSQTTTANERAEPEDTIPVLSGHLRYGQISLGEELVLGPFEARLSSEGSYPLDSQQTAGANPSPNRDANRHDAADPSMSAGMPRPPGANPARLTATSTLPDSAELDMEWVSVRVVSIRNLRLPVRRLLAGQTGTIGIAFSSIAETPLDRNVPVLANRSGSIATSGSGKKTALAPDKRAVQIPTSKSADHDRPGGFPSSPRTSSTISNFKIRKGMVLVGYRNKNEVPVSYSGFVARFPSEVEPLSVTVGALVVVYTASVRASARVVHLLSRPSLPAPYDPGDDDVFGFDDGGSGSVSGATEALFQFASSREWVELGRDVLVIPGGGPGLYGSSERGERGVGGLEGFVGKVIEVID